MQLLELEKTYLAKYLPNNLVKCEHKEIIDIYIPQDREHPQLRIRKNGDVYEMTKKVHAKKDDWSKQTEHTIKLDIEEYKSLASIKGKIVDKIRYYYAYQDLTAEIDIFQGDLLGLVLIDFEFDSDLQLEEFKMPNFCLAEVTQEEYLAGGKLCGKVYKDIENELKKFNYNKLHL